MNDSRFFWIDSWIRILGLESCWHFLYFILFFQINFFFQNSSISQILLCGERALALEGGFVTKSLCSPGP